MNRRFGQTAFGHIPRDHMQLASFLNAEDRHVMRERNVVRVRQAQEAPPCPDHGDLRHVDEADCARCFPITRMVRELAEAGDDD